MRPEVRRLLKQADRDLDKAQNNISIQAYEVPAFLVQQGIEKYLKAAGFVIKRGLAPHTHALTGLGEGLGVPSALCHPRADLTPDYTVSRYPDAANAVPYELYDEEATRTKLGNAQEVVAWLRQRISG